MFVIILLSGTIFLHLKIDKKQAHGLCSKTSMPASKGIYQKKFKVKVMDSKNYYRLLKIDRNATEDDIKKAYRKLAMAFHPDTNSDKDAEDKFKAISEAYGVLSDNEKRQIYDRTGSNQFAGFGNRAHPSSQRGRGMGRCMGKCSGFDAILRRRSWYAKKRAATPDPLPE